MIDLPVVDRHLDVARERRGASFTEMTERASVAALPHRYRASVWDPEVMAMIRGSVPVELFTVRRQASLSTL